MSREKNRGRNTLVSGMVLLVSMAAAYSGPVSAGSLDDKLLQCRSAYEMAHDPSVSQKEALEANYRHLKLMKELLAELNRRNADRDLTQAELQENVMVVSHLLEMLVGENLAEKERTWGLNY